LKHRASVSSRLIEYKKKQFLALSIRLNLIAFVATESLTNLTIALLPVKVTAQNYAAFESLLQIAPCAARLLSW